MSTREQQNSNITYRKDSFLKYAGLIDQTFLDLNNLPVIATSASDETYIIGHGYDERPDLLAFEIYGTSRLWWVFALKNPDVLVDPIRDFKSGTKIILPSPDTIKTLTSR